MDFGHVLYQSLFAFITLFIISKLLGKKQVAQLEFTDYVIGISIGSIAAEMATETQIPYYHFIIGMIVFAVLDVIITLVSRKAMFLKSFLKGKPIIIIEKGQINYKNLKKSKLDINELVAQCRVCGYFDMNEINYCIFETSGDFSVLPKSNSQAVKQEDLNIQNSDEDLNAMLVVDGKIIKNALISINKDEDWLLKKLKIKNKKEIKKLLLASYNIDSDTMSLHYKK